MEDDTRGTIAIAFSHDGDGLMDVTTTDDPEDFSHTRRFRTWVGGGRSSRVLNAIRFLAKAILLDNRDFPQRPRPSAEEF
jgi:hypothetical protein